MRSAVVILGPSCGITRAVARENEADAILAALSLALLPVPKFISYIDRHGEMQLAAAPVVRVADLHVAEVRS